jgi:hypothetical protein
VGVSLATRVPVEGASCFPPARSPLCRGVVIPMLISRVSLLVAGLFREIDVLNGIIFDKPPELI